MQSKSVGYDKQFLVFDAKTGLSRTIYTYKASDYIYNGYCPSCSKEIKINPKLKSVQCQYCQWTGHFQLELKSKENGKMKGPKATKQKEQLSFFETLFEGGYKADSWIEIRTITTDGKYRLQSWYKLNQIKKIIGDLHKFKNTNIFFGVLPRIDRIGQEEYVKEIGALWLDQDGNLDQIKRFELPPSIIISSGTKNHYHIYWLLDKVYPVKDRAETYIFKGYVKGLAQHLKADTKPFDLPRVLRVPYTQNRKDEDNPKEVKLIELHPERRYKLSQFKKYYVVVEDIEIESIKLKTVSIPERFREDKFEDKFLTELYLGTIRLTDNTRTGKDWALAHCLLTYGYTNNEIAAILTSAPYNKDKVEKKEMTIKYLKHTIGKAKAAFEKTRKWLTGYEVMYGEVIEPKAPIGKGFVIPERYTILAAWDGEGKTCFLVQLALCLVSGTPMMGIWPIKDKTRVLYLCGQNSRGDIKEKMNMQKPEIEKLIGHKIDDDIKERLVMIEPININFMIDNRKTMRGLIKKIYQTRPQILIFDPLADFVGTSESLDKDTIAREVAKNLNWLARKFNVFPILVTHFTKGEKVLPDNIMEKFHGSRYWINQAASQIAILKAGEKQGANLKKIYTKFKTQPEQNQPIKALFNRETLWLTETTDISEIRKKAKLTPKDVVGILQRLCEGSSVPELFYDVLMNEFRIKKRAAQELTKAACDEGLIIKDKGQFVISKIKLSQRELFKKNRER